MEGREKERERGREKKKKKTVGLSVALTQALKVSMTTPNSSKRISRPHNGLRTSVDSLHDNAKPKQEQQ